ncbi:MULTISPECIES: hypothetical protein [Amycolatopsis]|uniref:Uncharacterized protein n=1 Tax=Amycolatopsis thermalba TaxID=944492 RepID=A0ABY4NXK1_9PSEU|nr:MULTISPECIES: hypothetical protein [Amycolatopsis]OXM72277.1 hypothetical protein CF166_16100 [Amycolatopsis sp. KNN50.9b]UQS24805.1 hypothetical protein L1857_19270 [Amycolatopsis thermalba]
MTIRLHSAWFDAGRSRQVRLRSLRRTVSYLLGAEAEHRLWPENIGTGRVAVVRDFDHDSRQIRNAVRAGADVRGWSLLELPVIPGFGQIPVAADIRVVVPGHESLTAAARRCAAFWRCGVLAPATAGTLASPASLVLHPAPAVALSSSHDWYDHAAERWALRGELAFRCGTGQWERAEDVLVHPHDEGVLMGWRGWDRHLVPEPVTIRIERAAGGTLDGHAQTFPSGEYLCVPQRDRFHQVFWPGVQT